MSRTRSKYIHDQEQCEQGDHFYATSTKRCIGCGKTNPSEYGADVRVRDRARAMAAALESYADHRHNAIVAVLHDDERSAELSRAEGRADLHEWPDILKMLEWLEAERAAEANTMPDGS